MSERWMTRISLLSFLLIVAGGDAMASKNKKNVEEVPVVTVVEETGNLSKKHRDDLIGKIGAIRDFLRHSADTNATQLLAFAADLEKEVRTRKYGLVFEEHKERVDVELEKKLPVLTENKKRFIDNGGELNFLIEGDNLAALKLLKKTHKGKIDFIYIDPPYNTGDEDFIYNDSYVEKDDLFRHSKWLSFIKKRLELARELLTQQGAIFISIDDNEYAALKLLCDDVFGEKNFVNTIAVKMSEVSGVKMSHVSKKFPKLKEYCVVYCRNADEFVLHPIIKQKTDNMEEFAKYAKYYSKIIVDKSRPVEKWEIVPVDEYAERIGIDLSDSKALLDFKLKNADQMVYRTNNKAFASIKCDKKLAVIKSARGLEYVWWEGKQMLFLSDYVKAYEGDIWTDISTINLNKEGYVDFTNGKKPLKLIERCMDTAPTNIITILDFFAGSGTTGHAAMRMNAADKGKRRFILVQNNENGICEKVTYERLKRVIAKEGYKARLKYFKIDYVPIEEKVYLEYADDLLKYIRELVELENGVDFARDKTTAIVLTEKELETFAADEDKMKVCKSVYVGHNILIGSRIRRKIESKGIQIRMIPQYYYSEEGV